MKKILLLPLLALTLLATAAPSVHAAPNAQIQNNSTSYLDSVGYLHIVGEVKNIGDQWLNYVKITATLKDQKGVVQDVTFTYTELDRLPPGASSGFDIVELDTVKSAATSTYTLSLAYQQTDPLPASLTVLNVNAAKNSISYYEILGEVKNTGTTASEYTKLAATFYSTDGKVVGVGFTYTDPSTIQPGATKGFKLTFLESQRSSLIKTYAMAAQSHQYIGGP